MKKLLLLAAFGLLASPAFAQSTATVDQDGIQNDAVVMQTGSNGVTVTQTGDKQVAGVDQNGSGNTGTITQTEIAAIVPNSSNSATLAQDGEDNLATITQTSAVGGIVNNGSKAAVGQAGSSHEATVIQGARTHTAEVNQSNTLGGSGSEALIQQSSNEGGFSFVDQTGDGNYAQNYQRGGSSNDSDIDQIGDDNQAYVTQDIDTNTSESAVAANAVVVQNGDGNMATVDQLLQVNAVAHIEQRGNLNTADIDQTNSKYIDPSHNASISQLDGNSNYGRIQQEGYTEARNEASITQKNGDGNDAFLIQQGDGGSHMATVTQDGSSNRVEGLGGLGTAALQDGTGHTMTVMQTGTSHVAQVGQMGSGNTANVIQD